MPSDEKKSDVAKILDNFGKYQMLQYFYACIPVLFITILNINYVFLVGDIEYRCLVPECDLPPSPNFNQSWWPSHDDRCTRPVLNSTKFIAKDSCDGAFTSAVEECDKWVYESEDSVVATLNLACDPWRASLVGTVHSIGLLVSMLMAGVLSDKIGRKPTLMLCTTCAAIGHLKAFAPSYTFYIVLEFIEAVLSGGCYTAAMVLMIEISNSKGRVLSGVLFAYAIYVGETLFAAIAMFVPNWKHLLRIIYTPPLFCLLIYFFIKESPRWQVLNGKTEQAIKTFEIMAEQNKVDCKGDIKEQDLLDEFNVNKTEKREGVRQIVRSRQVMKTLAVAGWSRLTVSFVYYGLMINSVLLPGNKYTNFMLASVMSFPGELTALYLMNKIGRRLPLIVGFFLCSILCITSGFVPEEFLTAKITLFLLGKMVIACCYTGSVTYTLELFPTSTRGTLVGVCSLFSQLGGTLAPLTPILATVSPVLPTICFGVLALITSLLLMLLPETKGRPLHDTIQQIESAADAKKAARDVG